MSRGGVRSGAGRPKGEPSVIVRIPQSLAPLVAMLSAVHRGDFGPLQGAFDDMKSSPYLTPRGVTALARGGNLYRGAYFVFRQHEPRLWCEFHFDFGANLDAALEGGMEASIASGCQNPFTDYPGGYAGRLLAK